MKYVESIKSHPLKNFWNFLSILKLSSYCKELVRLNLEQIEDLRHNVDDIEKQIEVWKKIQSEEPQKDYSEFIDFYSKQKIFFEDNGKLILISIDVTECFRHLVRSKDDWEYRFFARRLYTLMHETRDALMRPLGSHRKEMMALAPTTFS